MSQPAKDPEPSIDEILASIRRSIVPDDDADKPAARKPGSRKPAAAATSAPVSPKGRPVESANLNATGDQRSNGGPHDGPALLKREAGGADVDNVPGDPEEAAAPGIALTE